VRYQIEEKMCVLLEMPHFVTCSSAEVSGCGRKQVLTDARTFRATPCIPRTAVKYHSPQEKEFDFHLKENVEIIFLSDVKTLAEEKIVY
jgi:hypothetical protein